MCGLVGIVSKNPVLVSEQRIQKGIDTLIHRGPQGKGVYVNIQQTIALGHRRLSIIDLSNAASQPMSYLDRYHIILNGEIYNYIELREDLKKKGFLFHSNSDTEVAVAAYVAWGKDCLQQFDGAFAFAIWDEKEQQLFAARDRFGEKPFYYFYDEEQLLFASEIKALWSMGVAKEVNTTLLYNFLSIDYTGNPANPQESFYDNIHRLPAASMLTYTLSSHKLCVETYWQIDPEEINETITEKEAIEQFQQLFAVSIQKRLRSDVPIGTSLSGGLDSASVIAFCEKVTTQQYTHKSFTASFKNFEKDETRYAQQVGDKFGLKQYIVEIADADIVSIMQKMMFHQEEPVSSASPLAQYKVYECARQNGVTVLLDGQGADEVLAGYYKYYKWYWGELYGKRRLHKTKELKDARALGIKEPFGWKNKIASLLPDFATSLLQAQKSKKAYKHPHLDTYFAFTHKRELFYSTPAYFNLNSALYFNTFVNGLENLLKMADRNSMAHSVEVRLPFLNHQLVTFLFTLPPHFKIHQGWTKWLLRKSVENKLPSEIVWRKDKIGFEPPQKQWMQNKAVQQEIQRAKEILVQHKVLNASVLTKKIQPHDAHVVENRDWKYWSAADLFRH